ncbi:non-specific lipid transfer protein GPI-anchored 5-like [Typha angustifolia]|uniref:non-specific lipid transfer protein GPI-anchored 5-like n=1 Tax=Typha angustifolia TaxID=59011 RepID=UPI003C2E4E93
MALRPVLVCLVAVLALTLSAYTSGQSDNCSSAIISLAPCLDYISGNASTPSSSCCSQLASVVQSDPQCLCTVLNGGGSSLGINVNQTKALALPDACKVKTPPVSECNTNGAPKAAPEPSPATPTTETGGSKTVPATGEDSSDGTFLAIPVSFAVTLLSVVAYFSISPAF